MPELLFDFFVEVEARVDANNLAGLESVLFAEYFVCEFGDFSLIDVDALGFEVVLGLKESELGPVRELLV